MWGQPPPAVRRAKLDRVASPKTIEKLGRKKRLGERSANSYFFIVVRRVLANRSCANPTIAPASDPTKLAMTT